MASGLGMQRLGSQRLATPTTHTHARSFIRAPQPCTIAAPRGFGSAVQRCARQTRAQAGESVAVGSVDTVSVEMPEGTAASVAEPVEVAGLLELQQDTFWRYLEAAGSDLVIVDFFTDWCGPCKLIYPELVKLSAELQPLQGSIVKFNCNKANKDLGKELKIRVAPTFFLYRNKVKLAEMTGAKIGQLRSLINDQQAAVGRPLLSAQA